MNIAVNQFDLTCTKYCCTFELIFTEHYDSVGSYTNSTFSQSPGNVVIMLFRPTSMRREESMHRNILATFAQAALYHLDSGYSLCSL